MKIDDHTKPTEKGKTKSEVQMKINLLKLMLENGTMVATFFALRIWTFIKWFFGTKTHWAGLIPTALLAVAALLALQKTSDQLRILKEQISYVREPVLHVYARPMDDHPLRIRLEIANVGNDTLENILPRFGLFLVTDNEVYSYGQFEQPHVWIADTTRKPKERIWPRGFLAPNEEVDMTSRFFYLVLKVFLGFIPEEDEIKRELCFIRHEFQGEYVLFVDCSYRRISDFAEFRDTTYILYDPLFGMHEDLKDRIGGYRVLDRIATYLRDGPQLSINIKKEKYIIYKHSWRSHDVTVLKSIPREQNADDS